MNHFQSVPNLKKSRSVFNMPFSHKFTCNLGDIVPFYALEVYPGDEFNIDANLVIRLTSTFIKVPFDNLFIDTYFFYVRNRLIDKNWRGVMGENLTTKWANEVNYTVPGVQLGTIEPQTLADYLGLPTGIDLGSNEVSQYPFRAFAKVWDDWFRNENTQNPVLLEPQGVQSINNNPWTPGNIFGRPPRASKLHDYFTSCLPQPQKGNPVDVPISMDGDFPVVATDTFNSGHSAGMMFYNVDKQTGEVEGLSGGGNVTIDANGFATEYDDPVGPEGFPGLAPANLHAVLSGENPVGITVNDMRYAFQLQKLLERDARSGTRYVEYLNSHFGVYTPDYIFDRAVYLGGNRQPITITQVPQTSAGSEESPQANLAAYSQTVARSRARKAFLEHGWIIGVAVIRQKHTYQQGIERFWFRKSRYDFYDPVFANIGEQPVYKKELFADKTTLANDDIFGYNEAWADLRFKPDRISGYLRSSAPETLDVWHFGDKYDNAPSLNDQFLLETPAYLDRTISQGSNVTPNFMVDVYVKNRASRVMPAYSVPSLIDHN